MRKWVSFAMSVTLRIKVATPKQRGFLRGLWRSYIPGFKVRAVNPFELSCGNGVIQMDGWTDRQTAP